MLLLQQYIYELSTFVVVCVFLNEENRTVGLAWLQVVYIISNLTAFTLHLLVAEIWLRITHRKRAVQQNVQGVPAHSSASH